MAEARKVCRLADVPADGLKVLDIDDRPIVLRYIAGTLHAIENICPHRGGPIGEGDINGNTITCPWHDWSFDLSTCQNTMNPAAVIRKFPVRVEGDDVFVEV